MIQIRTLACGAYQANAYLLWKDERDDLLLIDPGDDLPLLEEQIRLSGHRLTDILLTHGHFDHMLAAAPLKAKYGARLHIHPADASMLKSVDQSVYNAGVCRLPFSPADADAPYPTGDAFDLTVCGIALRGLHTPGHTPGGVTLICNEAHTVFTGDTIFAQGYGRYDLPGGDLHSLMDSLKTLLRLPRELTVRAGHGEADTMAAIAARWHLK